MIDPQQLEYPPPQGPEDEGTGLFPVDFLIEDVIRIGLNWFKTDPKAPDAVFSHFKTAFLSDKYGEKKITEILDYLKKYDVRIVQHFTLIDEQLPVISIQLLDGNEMPERAGLADHAGVVDAMNADQEITGRSGVRYSPILDNVHIGIHTGNTPDLCKYLYYLVIYSLLLFKPELEKRGLQLSTFRATDLSRINEYLPQNVYSRFVNFSVFTIAKIDSGAMPMVSEILGVHGSSSDDGENVEETGIGIGLKDIGQGV